MIERKLEDYPPGTRCDLLLAYSAKRNVLQSGITIEHARAEGRSLLAAGGVEEATIIISGEQYRL